MKTALLTTIFPASENFSEDFFNSLEKQTCKDFDIIVINDGVKNFQNIADKYKSLNIIEFKATFSPVKNREFGIQKTTELGYENIIFGDSDDFFEENRIKTVLNLLEKNDIVINDLNIFYKNETKYKFLSPIVTKQELGINYFFDKNIAGLSNTAIKTSLLKNKINFNSDLTAADWFFITILLLRNKQANVYFTNKTSTYYRQYEQNTIGINNIINQERIKLGINVKLIHYKSLISFCKKNNIQSFVHIFESKYNEILKLNAKTQNPDFLNKYIKVVKSNFNLIYKGWWSEIISLKEFKKYENKTNEKQGGI